MRLIFCMPSLLWPTVTSCSWTNTWTSKPSECAQDCRLRAWRFQLPKCSRARQVRSIGFLSHWSRADSREVSLEESDLGMCLTGSWPGDRLREGGTPYANLHHAVQEYPEGRREHQGG